MSAKNSIDPADVWISTVAVSGLTEEGHPKVVLVTPDAGSDDAILPVGAIVDGCLDVSPDAARRLVFSPRVLRLIAAEVEHWANRAQVEL